MLGNDGSETLLAIGMLVFTGVVVMVMQFTVTFFKMLSALRMSRTFLMGVNRPSELLCMDSLVELLSQPGISAIVCLRRSAVLSCPSHPIVFHVPIMEVIITI